MIFRDIDEIRNSITKLMSKDNIKKSALQETYLEWWVHRGDIS